MKIKIATFLLCLALLNPTTAATVHVDPIFQGSKDAQTVVPPGQFKVIPIGAFSFGDQVAIQVAASNKIYNDITACFATEEEARTYAAQGICRGYVKAKTPLVIEAQASATGQHYLVLDNRYAALIQKNVFTRIIVRKRLPDEEVEKIRSFFTGAQNQITSMFDNSDINIHVKPCGQSNAFSNNQTADITFCTELIHDMLSQRNVGALVGVLFHEYGHSLLNRWGEPGSSEEDMADQFAVAMILRGGDSGRRMLQGWIQYWNAQDSQAEARNQLSNGDTHSLSIQRARNIQHNINYPEEFMRRWNKMLYRHMKRDALEQVIAKPSKSDDVDLATEARRSK